MFAGQGVINSEFCTLFAVSNLSKVAWLTTINKAPKHNQLEKLEAAKAESNFNKHFEPVLVCCGFFLTVR